MTEQASTSMLDCCLPNACGTSMADMMAKCAEFFARARGVVPEPLTSCCENVSRKGSDPGKPEPKI